jgi:hypothetical protein
MREINPEIKALAEEYSRKIQSISDKRDSEIKALYEEYTHKHQCLMRRREEGQDDTRIDYHTILVSPSQTPEQGSN